jgi:hypothetical protein
MTILAAAIGAVIYMLALKAWSVARPFNPKVGGPALQARVVRFGTIPSRWQAHQVLVIAATPDGRTGEGVIARARLNELDCKIGSPMDAHLEGPVLVVDASTCGKGE